MTSKKSMRAIQFIRYLCTYASGKEERKSFISARGNAKALPPKRLAHKFSSLPVKDPVITRYCPPSKFFRWAAAAAEYVVPFT